MDLGLSGAKVLVTGATEGIGRSISEIFASEGCRIVIVARTRALDLTLVAGIPGWLLILAERLRSATGRPHLRALWPRLECLVHGGVPLGPFADELREAAGPGVEIGRAHV